MIGRAVVTGASGFIGTRLVERLLRDGIPVVALSRRGSGRPGLAADIRVADYADAGALQAAFAGAQVVFHLAARAHQLSEDATAPGVDERYRAANVDSAVAVAQAARAAGLRRVVLVSSIGVNGNATSGRPFSADDRPNPVEPYAKSKWLAEQSVAQALAEGPTDHVILRPPLVYGPGCPGNFLKLMNLAARAPLLPLGGLRAPRTLIGVDNLVEALLVAATHPQASRRTFVVGDARDTDVGEILRTLVRGCGRSPRTVVDVPASWLAALARIAGKGDTWNKLAASLQVDGSAFRHATGWQAPQDPVDGMLEAARHHRMNNRASSP